MKIKSAYKPPQSTSIFSILTLIVFSISTIALFNTVKNPLIPILVASIGLVVFVMAINKDHRRQGGVEKEYVGILNNNFRCPKCNCEIKDKVEHEDEFGVPLLYFCKDCDVLWFTGTHIQST